MKKVIIFRFGSSLPLQKEGQIISEITQGGGVAVGMSSQFGVVSIASTHLEPARIVELFNKVAEDTNDSLPVIVFEEGKGAEFNFDPVLFPKFKELDAEFRSVANLTCTLSLDELLDLVKSKGVKGLTEVELKRLKELSK
jgi:hypothetical protein